jgi:hypothetical protein
MSLPSKRLRLPVLGPGSLEGRNGIARGANPWFACKPDIQVLEGRQGCWRVEKHCDLCHPPGFRLLVGNRHLGLAPQM